MNYVAKYIKPTKIKEVFVKDGTRIRISAEAKSYVIKKLDNAVVNAVNDIINKLPKISKGNRKGSLKRITIKKEDVLESPLI